MYLHTDLGAIKFGQESKEKGEVEPRLSKRPRKEKAFGLDILTYLLKVKTQTFKEVVSLSKEPQ